MAAARFKYEMSNLAFGTFSKFYYGPFVAMLFLNTFYSDLYT